MSSISELTKNNSGACYIFDIDKLKERANVLRTSLPSNIGLCYAVKANTFVIREITDDMDRLEICSPGEAYICQKLGVDSRKMVISGVYKTPSFIEELVANKFDGIFTAESVQQFELLKTLANKYNCCLDCLLRLTNDSQFGMNESDIEEIISSNPSNINILGIQYFSGTQKTSVKKYRREIEYLDNYLTKLKDEFGFEAGELEYGTGFPVSYFEGEDSNEAEIFEAFSELLNNMTNKPQITLEIGRSLVASCGSYYTHIVDMKTNKKQDYLLIDGGMHHIVYFGQYMAMKMPKLHIEGKDGMAIDEEKKWTICGSLCSMNDIVAKQVSLPEVTVGDVIVFENVGAYSMTEGISLFLSRDLPEVYLKKGSELLLVRDRFETEKLNTPNYERK